MQGSPQNVPKGSAYIQHQNVGVVTYVGYERVGIVVPPQCWLTVQCSFNAQKVKYGWCIRKLFETNVPTSSLGSVECSTR